MDDPRDTDRLEARVEHLENEVAELHGELRELREEFATIRRAIMRRFGQLDRLQETLSAGVIRAGESGETGGPGETGEPGAYGATGDEDDGPAEPDPGRTLPGLLWTGTMAAAVAGVVAAILLLLGPAAGAGWGSAGLAVAGGLAGATFLGALWWAYGRRGRSSSGGTGSPRK